MEGVMREIVRFVALLLLFLAVPVRATIVRVEVSIANQTATVFEDNVQTQQWAVSTGRPGHDTHKGTFTVTYMDKHHRSSIYKSKRTGIGSPMPYAVFYDGDRALHGTTDVNRLGTPASHGCVRLHPDNAETFFNIVTRVGKQNVTIIVS